MGYACVKPVVFYSVKKTYFAHSENLHWRLDRLKTHVTHNIFAHNIEIKR